MPWQPCGRALGNGDHAGSGGKRVWLPTWSHSNSLGQPLCLLRPRGRVGAHGVPIGHEGTKGQDLCYLSSCPLFRLGRVRDSVDCLPPRSPFFLFFPLPPFGRAGVVVDASVTDCKMVLFFFFFSCHRSMISKTSRLLLTSCCAKDCYGKKAQDTKQGSFCFKKGIDVLIGFF